MFGIKLLDERRRLVLVPRASPNHPWQTFFFFFKWLVSSEKVFKIKTLLAYASTIHTLPPPPKLGPTEPDSLQQAPRDLIIKGEKTVDCHAATTT